MKRIVAPYFLTVAVPIRVDKNGSSWTDRLWAKDLALHLDYIDHLTVACPRLYEAPNESDVSLQTAPFDRIRFVLLDQPRNHLDAIRLLPRTLRTLWQAIDKHQIVHTGFGFWPISEGIMATPIARIKHRLLITNIESSSWRISTANPRFHERIRSAVLETLHRACVRSADVRLFTSKAYLKEFLPNNQSSAYVTPATWIDENVIVEEAALCESNLAKEGPVRLLFAGRLTEEKGTKIFLEAARLVKSGTNLRFSVIGEGPLKDSCQAQPGIDVHDTVPYGPRFFKLLQGYDAVVVPSLSDEQPRIIYDAFSQGIPVLGARTGGIQEVVTNGITGKLFAPGDSGALAQVMEWAASSRSELQEMGIRALRLSNGFTHKAMHEKRREIILQKLRERPHPL